MRSKAVAGPVGFMFNEWAQLGDFTDDLNAALAARSTKPRTTTTKKTPGATVKALLKPVNTAGAMLTNDELVAGARLQWSVALGLSGFDQFRLSLPGSVYAEKTDALRRLMESAGLQSVQVIRSSFDTASYVAFKQYPGVFVAEMTTPFNRRLKADLLYDLGQLAAQAGLSVDPNPARNNLAVMRQGANGTQGGLPVEAYKSSGNQGTGFDSFLNGLGLSTPWALLAGAAFIIVIARR